MTRVLIVDDHRSIRSGLSMLFAATGDLEVCGTAHSGEAGLVLALTLDPDVVVMDLSMPGMGGVAATRAIVQAAPGARVIVLSWHDATETRREVQRAGACGLVLKGAGPDSLVDCVRAVARGEVLLPADATP